MRVVDFIFKSTAFYREMRFNLFIFLVLFLLALCRFGLFVIWRYVIDVNRMFDIL